MMRPSRFRNYDADHAGPRGTLIEEKTDMENAWVFPLVSRLATYFLPVGITLIE